MTDGKPSDSPATPATGWARVPDPADAEGTPATGRRRVPDPDPGPVDPEDTSATGWVVAGDPAPEAAEAEGEATSGWVVAGSASAEPASPAPGPVGSGWPELPDLGWAQDPVRSAPSPAPSRRRRGLLRWFAAPLLVLLLVAGGGAGFLAATRPSPAPTPPARTGLRLSPGNIGVVSSPLISLALPAGWLEQQQSATDVRLAHFPNGSMDINVRSAAGAAVTPQEVLQQRRRHISGAPTTVGSVTTCVPPVAYAVDGRPGFEEGFRWQERGLDGRTLFTNCELDWASVENGRVYFWQTFDTLARLRASIAAAVSMQRLASWHE